MLLVQPNLYLGVLLRSTEFPVSGIVITLSELEKIFWWVSQREVSLECFLQKCESWCNSVAITDIRSPINKLLSVGYDNTELNK